MKAKAFGSISALWDKLIAGSLIALTAGFLVLPSHAFAAPSATYAFTLGSSSGARGSSGITVTDANTGGAKWTKSATMTVAITGHSGNIGNSVVVGNGGSFSGLTFTVPNDATIGSDIITVSDGSNTATQPFTVTIITPTLSVTNSPVTYNGSSQAATVAGSVAGTTSNVKYNTSSTVPTNAGTYAVTADFAPTDSVHYSNLTGASAGNFVINKANQATLTVTNLPGSAVYQQAGITATTSGGSGTGTITFGVGASTACSAGSSTGAVTVTSGTGTCAVTATKAADTNYNLATSSPVSVTIGKTTSTTAVTCPASVTYTGVAQTPCTVSVTGAGGLSLTPTPSYTSNTNAGTANASYSYAGSTNYSTSSDNKNFTINKATPTIQVTGSPVVFNGSAQSATITSSVPGNVTNVQYNASTTVPTDVNTYAVTADFTPTDATNYASLSGASAGNFVINAAPVTITSVNSISNINVANGTSLGSAGLPTTVGVTLSDLSTAALAVVWDGGTPVYNGNTAATYAFVGTLTLSGGVTNPGNLTASVNVVVAAPVPTLSSIAITIPANKLTYTVGQTLDITGLVVTGTYSDSSTSTLAVSPSDVTGFDSSATTTGQVLTITLGGKTTTYTVDITAVPVLSSAKDITAFSFPQGTGVISGTDIAILLPFGTGVTALVPTITLSGGTVSPLSGVPQDFSGPVTYTVTAADASTQAYTVTITFTANLSSGGNGNFTVTLPPTTPTPQVLGANTNTPSPEPEGQVLGASVFNFATNLKIGNKSDDVKLLQVFLNTHGFVLAKHGSGSPGNETNLFGGLTRATLIKFQKSIKVKVTGQLDAATRAYLNGLTQ